MSRICVEDPSATSSTTTATSAGPTTTTTPSTSGGTTETSAGTGTSSTTDTESTGPAESTGRAEDYALSFSGDGVVESQQDLMFDAQDFTIELWLDITAATVQGCLVNHMSTDHSVGWLFGIPGEGIIAFAFWPDGVAQQIIVGGPTTAEIGLGWHHLAATKLGTTLMLFVDGVPVAEETVPMSGPSAILTLEVGDQSNILGGSWRLNDAVIDDVRISNEAVWTDEFVPEADLEVLDSTVVLLRFDEGSGTVTTDETGLVFDVDGPAWVAGHE